jgi:hypothetical protein
VYNRSSDKQGLPGATGTTFTVSTGLVCPETVPLRGLPGGRPSESASTLIYRPTM